MILYICILKKKNFSIFLFIFLQYLCDLLTNWYSFCHPLWSLLSSLVVRILSLWLWQFIQILRKKNPKWKTRKSSPSKGKTNITKRCSTYMFAIQKSNIMENLLFMPKIDKDINILGYLSYGLGCWSKSLVFRVRCIDDDSS